MNVDTRPGYAHAPAVPVTWLVPYGPSAVQAKPLERLGAVTATLLALNATLGLFSSASAGWSVLAKAEVSPLPGTTLLAPGTGVPWAALGPVALTALTGICFMAWLFRATSNLGLYGVRPRRRPGWAIGAWFVPVISLWWPKQMVDDVVCGSRHDIRAGVDIRCLSRSAVVTAWWTTWLLAGACAGAGAGVVAFEIFRIQTLTPNAELQSRLAMLDIARLQETQAMWTMWAGAASSLSACFAILIVARATGDQRRRRREVREQVEL